MDKKQLDKYLKYCCFDLQRFIGLRYLRATDTGGYRGLLKDWEERAVLMCVYLSYCPFCGTVLDELEKEK